MENKIALVGCGNVGTALLEILHEKRAWLAAKYDFEFEVVLICDLMKGSASDPHGLDLEAVLSALHAGRGFMDFPPVRGTIADLLQTSGATILAEATPTDLKTGEPGLGHIKDALARGMSVVTSNKGPLAVAFDELTAMATECGGQFRYEGSVMSGTPLLSMLQTGMAGCTVTKIKGILNGTTNYMLTQMGEGMSYADALENAQSLGYAETDPSGDVEGWDAAVKVSILAKILFGRDVRVADVERNGITNVTQAHVKEAHEAGYAVKLLAGIDNDPSGFKAWVSPVDVPLTDPLASINGATNAVTVTTDNLGDVTLVGPGAGRRETGQALLEDIIACASRTRD